ncbi:HWE histidine kinase domain-containing protein [Azospirillum agricola]|uniref:HWE histidine kinase domain-containing protein n=1 Tax=Azospirillum agricola TaxID=1720247 RepID=UPI002D7E2D60|nr:HWE histidine kinase domain-containing protein [Azospirillum agricola]
MISGTMTVNLTNCDREPIHIPGSIQPHGCLLACDTAAVVVLRHSGNAADMIGVDGDLNGRPLEAVVGAEAAHTIRNTLARTREAARPAMAFGVVLASGVVGDVSVHRFKGNAIVEFEPASSSVGEPLELARAVIAHIGGIEQDDRLHRDAARHLRAMLGYDRVMIYQLGADGAGQVIAEAKRAGLESFLGQYFPGSDIPQQARALYLRNPIRIISDAHAQPIPLVPVLDESGEPLDLSSAHLRSVSPIHCEYLRNMGVCASMSISIIVDGALWGLIACHHYSPRALSMAQRLTAEVFGEFFSLHIQALRHKNTLQAATRARGALDLLLLNANHAGDIDGFLRAHLSDFASLIPCDGIAMHLHGRLSVQGAVPPAHAMPGLVRFAESVADGGVWASGKLSNAFAAAADYASDVAGVLVVPMSQRPRDFLLFFRKEVVETLQWAGNPEKTYEAGPLGDRLTPRKSFAIWKEMVHRQSRHWSDEDRQFAEAIRVAIAEVVLHHSELIADERAKAEVRQRMLNEELNHRVKNILALIGALVAHPVAEAQTLQGYIATLRGRIQALSMAHDQIVRGDGGGRLAGLLDAELSPYRMGGVTIALDGPAVGLDARAYSVLALVLHELATNAAKYGALSRSGGRLAVRWSVDAGGGCEIRWEESGGPAVTPPSRTGFGTVLIDRSVPFDLGGTSDIEYHPDGVRALFRIPARFITLHDGEAAGQPEPAPGQAEEDGADLGGLRVLIVEDQLVIAVGLEQMLADARILSVVTAASVAEALLQINAQVPDVAILDVNLGSGTSIAVAEELRRQGIPFLFATGYGDSSHIPATFKSVPIVRKPYEAASIIESLRRITLSIR